MCLCSTSTPLPSPPPPAFYRVSGLHFAVSPLPVHRKLASSDPHQTSCEEAVPWKTSPEMGGGERSREGVPTMMGVVSSGGLTALRVPNLTYLTVRPPPNIPLFFCWLNFVFVTASTARQVYPLEAYKCRTQYCINHHITLSLFFCILMASWILKLCQISSQHYILHINLFGGELNES